jgi:hypothetical protein
MSKIHFHLGSSDLTPESLSEKRHAKHVMASAHALCPTDMPHMDRMGWMADYFARNYTAQPRKDSPTDKPDEPK